MKKYKARLKQKFNLLREYIYDDQYDHTYNYIELFKDDVFINTDNRNIYGIDHGNLDILYDLIKTDLVEKVEYVCNSK